MQPLLIPAGHPDEQLATLLQGVITRQYSYGNSQYFFTLYPETGPEVVEGDVTNRYLVVLSSVDGTHAFYLEQNERGGFVKEAEAYWDEPEDLSTERMIMQVEGVHISGKRLPEHRNPEKEMYNLDDDPELLEAPESQEANLRSDYWAKNGSEELVLPLINTAIKEHHQTN